MHKIRISTLGAVVLALGVAACGGSSSSSSATASTSSSAPAASGGSSKGGLTESADPSGALKFTKSALSAKAGKVSIQFTNMAPENHNVTIATSSGKVVGSTPTFMGGTKSVSVTLKPGKYVFYCSVPGHRQGGMQGTLTVS
jgi:plastocyanin